MIEIGRLLVAWKTGRETVSVSIARPGERLMNMDTFSLFTCTRLVQTTTEVNKSQLCSFQGLYDITIRSSHKKKKGLH
jgi:predicted ATP-grasp superfamily ATP-dependent carboligase